MNDSQKYIKNLIFSVDGSKVANNTPNEYNSRQKSYLADRTARYASQRAYLSSDYVEADVQGLQPYFYNYTAVKMRLADIITPSATASKRVDDFKQVLIPDIDYLPIGAKINTMGNTWLVINPSNMSSAVKTSVIARCNATYNSYDYYGNIIIEPIVVEKYTMSNNDNDNSINLMLMDGYFNITCQLNDNTQSLGTNKRIILGDKPYHITGFTDFIQEFTYTPYTDNGTTGEFIVNKETGELIEVLENGTKNNFKMISPNLYQIGTSEKYIYIKDAQAYLKEKTKYKTHIMTFTARIDEPTENDDLTLGIAGGKGYVVSAELNGQTDLIAGQATNLKADFLINGKKVESTTEHPITWVYTSSDETVAKISSDGRVLTYKQGNATITARLAQNTLITATLDLSITEAINEPYIAFDGFTHDFISQYDSETISATYFENNLATTYPLKWTFSGATKKDYNAKISDDGRSVFIECLSACDTPLKITASYNGKKASVKINLVGY